MDLTGLVCGPDSMFPSWTYCRISSKPALFPHPVTAARQFAYNPRIFRAFEGGKDGSLSSGPGRRIDSSSFEQKNLVYPKNVKKDLQNEAECSMISMLKWYEIYVNRCTVFWRTRSPTAAAPFGPDLRGKGRSCGTL